ncbi:hypothetical protein J7643_01965 [bacterium]|nr:hypothetical protein [bacterium]
MADRDRLRQDLNEGNENPVEFEAEMPERSQRNPSMMDKAKAKLKDLQERGREAMEDIKHRNQ